MNLDIFENKKNFPLFPNKSVSKIIIIVFTCLNEGVKPWKYDSVPLESTLGTDFENIHIWCLNTMLYVQGKAKMNLFSNMNEA